ncbi:MAG: YihY/virulence factor BrkB family protein [Gemmataceae bacterium]|nr:YihY/virulence factor BrkB family protein [Gemmataceae bacterium]
MLLGEVWRILKEAVKDFSEDDAIDHGAALAFYTALGLAPLVLLCLSISAFFGEGTSQALIEQVRSLIGGQAAEGVDLVVRNAQEKPESGTISAIVGIVTIVFSASGIFAQLQSTLNRIWHVKPKEGVAGYWNWVRSRLLSIGMLLSVLFLMLVSLVLSAGIALVLPTTGPMWNLATLGFSTMLFIVLFAMIFKFLPDVEIRWRDVWFGATVTAILFAVGKYFIGLYLGQSGVASSYGAAGSLVALLLWVYYSSLILFFGVEITKAYTELQGTGARPASHAECAPNPATSIALTQPRDGAPTRT